MPSVPLSVGAYGDDVARLQTSLTLQGLHIAESERQRTFFGPATRQALREFQQRHALAITGTLDPVTAATIAASAPVDRPSPAPPSPVASPSPADRREVGRVEKGFDRAFNALVAAERLPPPPSSVANYLPYRIIGNQLLLSGMAPFFGAELRYTGKVGDSVSIDDARVAARLTGLNLLYVAQRALGTLDRVRNVVALEGMVNCAPAFTQPSTVIDGCSDLLVDVFGSDHGKHVRSAVGQNALPFDITVEISVTFEIDEAPDASTGEVRDHTTAAARVTPPAAALSAPVAGPASGGGTVAQLLLDYLALERATTIFGVPGGALVFVLDELKRRRDQFDFLVCRHETGAAYLAHGYALTTGELGVVLTTSGPSATNALTGAMNAQAANCSLLVISGEVAQQHYGEGYLQEGADARLNVGVIFRNALEYSAVVSSETNFATLFKQALRVARSQPPRAAHISLPNDVAGATVTGGAGPLAHASAFPRSTHEYRAVSRATDVDAVRATLAELASAKRPLILLGNGARQALADGRRLHRFTQLVEQFALPVMTTPDAKGIFPESHPLSLRNYGICGCRWPEQYMAALGTPEHFDALLVMGSSLGELATSVVASDVYAKLLVPTTTFVQVDLDQGVIGRTFPITRGIVADIGATIDALCDLGGAHRPDPTYAADRWRFITDLKAATSPFADPDARASQSHPLHPAALMRVINEIVTDGHIFIDAGNCVGWSLNNLVIDPPVRFHSALGMGPMGFGIGATIGGKRGAPTKPSLGIVGDGAFLMQGTELSTAAQYGIGAIIVVLQDNDLSMVSQGMGELFPPQADWSHYYGIGTPDLVKFSEGLGAQAVAVAPRDGPAAFAAALTNALRQSATGRPQVIVAQIDTTAMPPYGWPTMRDPL